MDKQKLHDTLLEEAEMTDDSGAIKAFEFRYLAKLVFADYQDNSDELTEETRPDKKE